MDKVENYYVGGAIKRTIGSTTIEECKKACEEDTTFQCTSVNFYKAAKTCYLKDTDRYTTRLTASTLYDYYERNCRGRTLMTLYVHTNVSLLTAYYPSQCEWEKMVGYYLYGYDLLTLTSKSPEECKQACEDENTFHCQSFDYRRDIEICYLAAASRDEIPLTAHYLHDYYGRNCIGIGV